MKKKFLCPELKTIYIEAKFYNWVLSAAMAWSVGIVHVHCAGRPFIEFTEMIKFQRRGKK